MNPEEAMGRIMAEYARAARLHARFNSAHEGYAVIYEEMDELWEEVKQNRARRSSDRLRKEAIQAAAMLMRFIVDLL